MEYSGISLNMEKSWNSQGILCRWRSSATGRALDFVISRSRVQILLEATLCNNLGQVVYTYMPLSPSSITWYRPKGGDLCGWGGNCRPGGKQWQPTAGWMTYGHLRADCLYTRISWGPNTRYRVWESLYLYLFSVQPQGKIVTNKIVLVRSNVCVKQLLTGKAGSL